MLRKPFDRERAVAMCPRPAKVYPKCLAAVQNILQLRYETLPAWVAGIRDLQVIGPFPESLTPHSTQETP